MPGEQLILSICFISLILILLIFFLLFILYWQRMKSNRFIEEKETIKNAFKEQLLTSKIEIQEQTLNHISMEIHDNVGQTLSLLKAQMNILEQHEELDKKLLGEAKANVSKAMTDLRHMARSLNTEQITFDGLYWMTLRELERLKSIAIFETNIAIEGEEVRFSDERQLILFRIIQEILQNIVKHAEAKNIEVKFCYTPTHFTLTISDNGKGFADDSKELTRLGMGLHNIKKRAEILGGEAMIVSTKRQGTSVEISINL